MDEQLFHLGVKMIIQNSQGRVLVLKHRGREEWDLPGGRIHHGESALEALQRIVKEETGLKKLDHIIPQKMVLPQGTTATYFKVKAPLTEKSDFGLIIWLHSCTLMEDQPVLLSPEYQEFLWVTWPEARQLLSIDCSGVGLNDTEEESQAISA